MREHYPCSIEKLFPTTIMRFDLSKHPHYSRMLDVVNKTKTSWHAIMKDAESTYDESTGNRWLDKLGLVEFKQTLEDCVQDYCLEYGLPKLTIGNSWMNRVGKGGAVKAHRHEVSVLSGAFYPIADKGSTPLVFKSPLQVYKMFEYTAQETFYNAAMMETPCEQGTLVLFPSWLEHYTDDNTTDNRVTISFNTNYLK
jgi:uncharacterized protein (TIGR02466 family)|tara:strand:- start:793 stop:1383 length:591 start_codon:yes stop_codon:yes gene_type:complete